MHVPPQPMTQTPHEVILIVDDQEENRRIVSSVLTVMHYECLLARSAEEAVQVLNARTPDLILLDVMMPGTDGIATCKLIKSEAAWADIPVIFLSAADDKNLIVQALEVGGVDYVTKPFNRAELVSRVRTQLALKRSTDQLRMLAEDKDEILGILAHDLKNSLAGMRLSATLLQSRISEQLPRCKPLIDNMLNATDRMLSFMKEFLANQRAEGLRVRKETVNLTDVVRLLVSHHSPAAVAKQITLNAELPAEAILVEADHEGVMQVLENLVSNAIKFTPLEGRVDVRLLAPSAGMARCIVRDSGPGFTQEDRERMFHRYARLSAQPTGDEPSTGLGLSIVKRLVNSMGGSISLAEENPDHQGAEFIVMFPILPAKETAPTDA